MPALTRQFDDVARQAMRGMEANPFASVINGRLKLHIRDALPVTNEVKALRGLIEPAFRVRIEDLLRDVDAAAHFTRAFPTTRGATNPAPRTYTPRCWRRPSLTARISALRPWVRAHRELRPTCSSMSRSGSCGRNHQGGDRRAGGLPSWAPIKRRVGTRDRFLLRRPALRRAAKLPADVVLSTVIRLLRTRHHCIHPHTSDQYSVFSTRVISCSPREALYVLDGLFENNTILRLREHYTRYPRLHGACVRVSYLLDYSFMPRRRDLADQHLCKLDRSTDYGYPNPLFRGVVDTDLIREQWDSLVRIAASLKNRTAPANIIIQRLQNSPLSDRLAGALTALGRAVKTIFILRYISDPDLRYRVQLQLNRGESRRVQHRRPRGDHEQGKLSQLAVVTPCSCGTRCGSQVS